MTYKSHSRTQKQQRRKHSKSRGLSDLTLHHFIVSLLLIHTWKEISDSSQKNRMCLPHASVWLPILAGLVSVGTKRSISVICQLNSFQQLNMEKHRVPGSGRKCSCQQCYRRKLKGFRYNIILMNIQWQKLMPQKLAV